MIVPYLVVFAVALFFHILIPYVDYFFRLVFARWVLRVDRKVPNKYLIVDALLLLIPIIVEDQISETSVFPHLLPIILTTSSVGSIPFDLIPNLVHYPGIVIHVPLPIYAFGQILNFFVLLAFMVIWTFIGVRHWKLSGRQLLLFVLIGILINLFVTLSHVR